MECDFSGWATKAGLRCSDGRTIMRGAFQHQDKETVPLVWQHGHDNPKNVLGHVCLEDRDEGTYGYAFFNDTPEAVHAKKLVDHKDIKHLSIWANELIERASNVIHGKIREVSLVLSGANPGALIDNVSIQHSDGTSDILDGEAIIHTGTEIEHAEGDPSSNGNSDVDNADGRTVQEIYESMSTEEQDVLHFLVAQAAGKGDDNSSNGDSAEQSGINNNDTNLEHENKDGNEVGTRNVFDKTTDDENKDESAVLSHDAMKGIFAAAVKGGSLKAAVEGYALQHGITNIETLFPEATSLTAAPEFFGRKTEWVEAFLGGTRKTPFSRIKTHYADLNFDDARAKGYIKGTMKKEEFFGTASRTTTPKTIYKKQKLDRDDIIDITDFDVVTWMKAEMRLMLHEEIARAALISDGRAVDDEDKINEENIRPIATDDDLYAIKVYVNLDDASSSAQEIIDAIVLNRQYYRGSGMPTMYTTETQIARFLLLKDGLGRRMYRSLDELATELRVSSIVPVEVMDNEPDIVCILVNTSDYAMGSDKGGQVTLFDDFDIDFNQYKYLIETRMSGALTKLKSAIVVMKTDGSNVLVTPEVPTFNGETGVVTVPTQTGVVYKNGAGATLVGGAQAALADGVSLVVNATPATGYYFSSTEGDSWTFTYHADA